MSSFETERLRLRPLTPDDTDELHRLWTEPGVRRYLWDGEVIARARVRAMIEASVASFEARGFGLWAVLPRAAEALVGFCGFWFFHEPPRLELLYGIAPACWNRGLATEAAVAMLRYGFEELSFERIEASTDAANAASARVLERAGMSFWKRETTNGLDTVYYSVSREAFLPPR
ncbi:MAG: GNAT family N-acetyltransferase [Acidobacteriota bacterium]|nr:GNAT family N-acetyltransferase [Acidobacteriota bacterium]